MRDDQARRGDPPVERDRRGRGCCREREQRHVATQLERERGRLVEAQTVAKMGSWEVDLQSLVIIWSEQTHRIFETDPARFHPTRPRFLEFIHPEDLEITRAEMRRARIGRHKRYFETRYLHKNGHVLTFAWSGVWSEPEQRHFFFGRDTTDRKAAEERQIRFGHKILLL